MATKLIRKPGQQSLKSMGASSSRTKNGVTTYYGKDGKPMSSLNTNDGTTIKPKTAPVSATVPTQTPSGGTYTVKAGDTLNAIAQKQGFKNYKDAGISGYSSGNPDLIRPGEVLTFGGYKPNTSSNPSGATAIINQNQDEDIANAPSADDVPTKDGGSRSSRYSTAFSEISEIFGADENRPSSPNFEQTYNKLRDELNVDDLEGYVNDLQTEEEEIFANLRERRTTERGKTVGMNVIEGRISETERQESERIDYIRRQKQTAVNQLQSANATIENLINFKKLDYDTARNEYNDKFSQQMNLFNTAKGIVDSEMSDEERIATSNRANLNIIYGAITEGTIDAGTITPEMKYQINKMEVSAGLPTGFYDKLQNQNPGGKILSSTARTSGGAKYVDVLYQNKDGSLTAKAVYLGASSEGSGSDTKLTEAELERSAGSEMAGQLNQKIGDDGKLSPADYQTARRVWVSKGFSSKAFDQKFANDYAMGAMSPVEDYQIDATVLNPGSYF